MAKELKTARELEAMILDRSKGLETLIHRLDLEVRPDPAYGWAAFVIAGPEVVGQLQAHANRVATFLRERYDLSKK